MPSSPASIRTVEAINPFIPADRSSAASRCGGTREAIFARVPDFHAELLGWAREGDTCWAEWHWRGIGLDARGVTIFAVRDDRILWGRLYMEDVEVARADIQPDPEGTE